MKRFIGIFLVFALCFSLASCSLPDNTITLTEPSTEEPTTLPVPEIEPITHSKEYKNASGKVVYTVDVVIPRLEEFENMVLMGWVNGIAAEVFEKACEKAENNIDNASEFMESHSSDTPWSRKIDFEVSFSNGRYFSFVIKEYFSMYGENSEPTLKSATFDIVNSTPCNIFDFSRSVFTQDEILLILVDNYLSKTVSAKVFNGLEVTEEQKNLIRDTFSVADFYLTDDGICFFLNKYFLEPSLSGTLVCDYTWNEISEIMYLPE